MSTTFQSMEAKLLLDTCTREDQPQVKALVISVHKEFDFSYRLELDYDLEDPLRHYTDEGGTFYVLRNGGQIVGTIAVKMCDSYTAELKRLYLLPEYRGQGWGAKLLEHALAFCRSKKFRTVFLDTNVKQIAAQALYSGYGFKEYKRGKNTIYMRLDLGRCVLLGTRHKVSKVKSQKAKVHVKSEKFLTHLHPQTRAWSRMSKVKC